MFEKVKKQNKTKHRGGKGIKPTKFKMVANSGGKTARFILSLCFVTHIFLCIYRILYKIKEFSVDHGDMLMAAPRISQLCSSTCFTHFKKASSSATKRSPGEESAFLM